MKTDDLKETPICECECHMHGTDVMHFMECCMLTYRKYLNSDGTVEIEEWFKQFREVIGHIPTFGVANGKYYWVHR